MVITCVAPSANRARGVSGTELATADRGALAWQAMHITNSSINFRILFLREGDARPNAARMPRLSVAQDPPVSEYFGADALRDPPHKADE
jgi:hypothetical protein